MKRALFIGRWQPIHDGHRWLFNQKLEQDIPILIAVRDTPVSASNPFSTEQVVENLEKEYSEQGRINNIRRAQSIAMYLDNKKQDVVVSIVAPYRWLREEFKERHKVNEIYLHTTEKRGKEQFFAKDYEPPQANFLDMDTTNVSVEDCINQIVKEFLE